MHPLLALRRSVLLRLGPRYWLWRATSLLAFPVQFRTWRVLGALTTLALTAVAVILTVGSDEFASPGRKAAAWSIYAGLLFLMLAVSARRRLLVSRFVWLRPSAAGEGKHPTETAASAPGAAVPAPDDGQASLATLNQMIAGELSRIAEANRPTQERRELASSSGGASFLAASVSPDDLDQLFASPEVAGIKVRAGPVEVPAGAVLRIVGTLVRAPRLEGSIYASEDHWVLQATLTGRGPRRTWLVKAGQGGSEPPLGAMAHELALRIHVDTGLEGVSSWRAYEAFLEGLEHYRESLRVPQYNAVTYLREATACYIKALKFDAGLDLAAYNLGVAYAQMGQAASARQAFTRVVQQNPQRWVAHYALAQLELREIEEKAPDPDDREGEAERLARVVALTFQVMALDPPPADRARTYNLRGRARRRMGNNTWHAVWAHALASWRAFVELRRAELMRLHPQRGSEIRRTIARELAATCLRAEAEALLDFDRPRRSAVGLWARVRAERRLLLANRLSPGDEQAFVLLNRVYRKRGRRTSARWAAERGRSARPDRPEALLILARAYAESGEPKLAVSAARDGFAAYPRSGSKAQEDLRSFEEALLQANAGDQACLARYVRCLAQAVDEDRSPEEVLPDTVASPDVERDMGVEKHLAMAAWLLRRGKHPEAVGWKKDGRASMDDRHSLPDWVRRVGPWGLEPLLLAELARRRDPEALREHLRLTEQDPLNPELYSVLATIALGRADFENAKRYLLQASDLDPESYDTPWKLGNCAWGEIYGPRPPLRSEAFVGAVPAGDDRVEVARGQIQEAIKKARPVASDDPLWDDKLRDRPWLIYWLGVLELERNQPREAERALQGAVAAQTAKASEARAQLLLAEALLRQRRWEAAREGFEAVKTCLQAEAEAASLSAYIDDLDSNVMGAWARRGQAMASLSLGDWQRALNEAYSATRIAEGIPAARGPIRDWWIAAGQGAMARWHLAADSGDTKLARELLEKAVARSSDPELCLDLADLLLDPADRDPRVSRRIGRLIERSEGADPAGELAARRAALTQRLDGRPWRRP